MSDQIAIRDITTYPVIGCNPEERLRKQKVLVTITVTTDTSPSLDLDDLKVCCNYATIYQEVMRFTNNSSYLTLESLANNLAQKVLLLSAKIAQVTVCLKKVEALSLADYPEITITRRNPQPVFNGPRGLNSRTDHSDVYLGLGSNMGDRLANITNAIKLLEFKDIGILDSSNMYMSPDFYGPENPYFYNCVIKVDTRLSPLELLATVKEIERELGRTSATREPRPIDIDILWFRGLIMDTDLLSIPHRYMLQRPFVLCPLQDIIGGNEVMEGCCRILPLKNGRYIDLSKVFIFNVLNATPDSFSGDGQLGTPVPELDPDITTIIDIGGESTRPGHTEVEPDREIWRVESFSDTLTGRIVSVDTRKAVVAEHFIHQGLADIINDVSGLKYDPEMKDIVKRHGIPVVCTHTTGTLSDFYQYLLKTGIFRWNIIVDPGFGVSKSFQSSVRLWSLDQIDHSFTHIVSHSRKGHVSKMIPEVSDPDIELDNLDLASVILATVANCHGIKGFRTHNYHKAKIMRMILNLIGSCKVDAGNILSETCS